MGLAERVTAGHESDRLLVVHRHAGKGLTNITGRGNRIGHAVGPLRIDVDQSHLNSGEWVRELPVAAIPLVTEPRVFRAPVGFVGLPGIDASATEAKRLQSHRFQGDVAGKNQ